MKIDKKERIMKLRLMKKNLDISKKEIFEKEIEKMEEVKGLFDKIIYDFDH